MDHLMVGQKVVNEDMMMVVMTGLVNDVQRV